MTTTLTRPSRRPARAVAAFAVLAALVSACGTVQTEEQAAADGGAGADSDASEVITVTDDQGREVSIDGPVERAVVLNSYSHEFIRAIGASDRVVGLDRGSLNRLPYLGLTEADVVAENLVEINYESVVAADPDVVIIPRNGGWQAAESQLEQFDIPVVVATAWDYDVFDDTIALFGQIFGETEGAERVAAFYDEIFGVLDDRLADVEPVPVYFETEQPYLTALPGSGFDQMISAAGGTNLFGDVTTGGDEQAETTVDPASVVERDPAVIFHELPPGYDGTEGSTFDSTLAEITSRSGFAGVDAVQSGEVYVTNGWATSGLSKALGALYLASWLHPDELDGVDPDSYLERWVTEFQDAEFLGADRYVATADGA